MSEIVLRKLIQQANRVDNFNKASANVVKYIAVIITPERTINTLGVDRKADYEDYVLGRSSDISIGIRLQPSVYINHIIPYRDNLTVQLIATTGNHRVVTEYTAIPLVLGNPTLAGEHSSLSNIGAISHGAMVSYEFQLLDPKFAKLRDCTASGVVLMGSVGDTIAHLLNSHTEAYIKDLGYDGIVVEKPIDNDKLYSAIVIPESTALIDVPTYLQESEKYGVYSKGLGCFFKQSRWWVYSLYDTNKYDTHPNPITIFRFPRDKVPTLDRTFFYNENGLTILATGTAEYDDLGDIDKQEDGVGTRLILPEKISGKSGSHYNAGRSISTRADSMSEFQLSERANGNNYTPIRRTPSSNPFKYASRLSVNNGIVLVVEWHNSDTGLIAPGAPCRYQYIDKENSSIKEGVVLGVRTDYKLVDHNGLFMNRSTMITLFLNDD